MSSSFSLQLGQAIEALESLELRQARAKLESLDARTQVESRMRGFWMSQLEIRSENAREALARIQATRERHGDHVSLLANRVYCHYLLNEQPEFRRALDELNRTFAKVQDKLSSESRYRTTISLGKFLEEEASVAQALSIYEQSMAGLEPSENPNEYYSLMAQILRLRSCFDLRDGCARAYADLIALKDARPSLYLEIEIQQALMHAELSFVGAEAAFARLEKLCALESFSDYDRRLFYFDGLESALLRGHGVPARELLNQDISADAFERALLAWSESPSHALRDALGGEWGATSLANILRLSTIAVAKAPAHSAKVELRRRVLLLLESLDAASRFVWLKRIDPHLEASNETLPIELDFEAGQLCAGAKVLELKGQKSLLKLAQHLALRRKCSVEEAFGAVWGNEQWNESHFHRLRNLVQRLNKSLGELTGVRRALRLGASGLESLVEIRRKA